MTSRNYPDSDVAPVTPELPTKHMEINLGVKPEHNNVHYRAGRTVPQMRWLAIFEPIKEEAIRNGLPGEWRVVKKYETPDGAITDASRMRKNVAAKKGYLPPGIWEFTTYRVFMQGTFTHSEFLARYITTPELSGNDENYTLVLRGSRGPA